MFSDINWLIVLVVFAGYIIVDGMYAFYTIAVVRKNAVAASGISFVMHFILAGGVLAYTKDYIYVFPLLKLVQNGEEIVIAKAGLPIANITAYKAQPKPQLGIWKDNPEVMIPNDFDDLDPEIISMFEESQIFPDRTV